MHKGLLSYKYQLLYCSYGVDANILCFEILVFVAVSGDIIVVWDVMARGFIDKYSCILKMETTGSSGILLQTSPNKIILIFGVSVWSMLHHITFCLPPVRTQIIQPPVDTRVLLGHTATLQCKVSSDPSVPFDIAWFHNDE